MSDQLDGLISELEIICDELIATFRTGNTYDIPTFQKFLELIDVIKQETAGSGEIPKRLAMVILESVFVIGGQIRTGQFKNAEAFSKLYDAVADCLSE